MLESFGIVNAWIYITGAFLLVVAPGPNSLYVLKTSILEGRRCAFSACGAVFLGDSLLILLAYLGIAVAIQSHPLIFTSIKIAGGFYLAYLGGKMIWATVMAKKKSSQLTGKNEVKSPTRQATGILKAFRVAFVLSLTNPKAILFYVAFFVQFIDASYSHPGIAYFVLALILQVFSLLWLSFLVTLGADCLKILGRLPALAKLGNTAVGSLFLLFAGKLILD